MIDHAAIRNLSIFYSQRLLQTMGEYPRFDNSKLFFSRFFFRKTSHEIKNAQLQSCSSASTGKLESDVPQTVVDTPTAQQVSQESSSLIKGESWYIRLKQGLKKTHAQFGSQLSKLLGHQEVIDDKFLESLDTLLISSDVGVRATKQIMLSVTEKMKDYQNLSTENVRKILEQQLIDILNRVAKPLKISEKKPFVILVVGVNGVGKTTTIGKLAKYYQSQGLSVVLAAGDTFRAAAVEQLQIWGERNNVPVVAQHTGADSASVIFDALQSAKSKNVDIVIADTAGRLHNKTNLMTELAKVKRVLQKLDPTAPHETLLVLDANTGQNATNQAEQFHESVGLNGLVLTKLDGTAKGGVIFALSETLGLPIRFIGVGEGIDDLRPFQAKEFVEAVLSG